MNMKRVLGLVMLCVVMTSCSEAFWYGVMQGLDQSMNSSAYYGGNTYNSSGYYNTGGDMSYLLDPQYTIQQVENQNYQEYLQFNQYNKKYDGSSYTYDEYKAMQGEAIRQLKQEGSGNTTTTQTRTTTTKKCAYCSGNGETIQHESVATFGLDGPSKYCDICKKSYSYGTVHAHHKCSHCGGSGVREF